MTIAYRYQDGIYLNITNRCPTRCRFCVKKDWKFSYRGTSLALGETEPAVAQIWSALIREAARAPFREIVFCGYGECTYRLPVLLSISRRARKRFPKTRLRLNTIGLGDLICARAIAPLLARALDSVSVSLNTANAVQWQAIHNPLPRFSRGFSAVLRFISDCRRRRLETTVTAVDFPWIDLAAVEALAGDLNAGFRLRPRLEQGP